MNMNVIFEKTRELGEAIKASEEYTHMKEIEARALKNEDAALTMGKYLEAKGQEGRDFRAQVTDGEVSQYLYKY